ncbi:MAG TPA: ATP-binding cassette domain-containing protein [Saprospiraceae bacterium]|nr:ATP-binding cassette domain-containing protein [Saprospiraceae bacterium]
MHPIIETRGLSFRYGKQQILKDISLSVPSHSIYGFLGPNGAGKSTTIKVLLGLLKVPNDTAYLFEKDISRHRIPILSKVGNLIETPSIYGHLNAYDNLKIMRTLHPAPKARIDEVLELVGLRQAARKKVKRFSMGMKQRLGIAMALFHDPDLLILDEPVNGLDPNGIQEVRALLLRLKEQGKTIFLSSHLLAEIEKLCTHLGIIKEGGLIFQGQMRELQAGTRRFARIKTNNSAGAKAALPTPLQNDAEIQGGWLIVDVPDDQHFRSMLQELINQGIEIYDMERQAPSLEDLFLDLVNLKS